jgi:hypothetical protein
LMPVLHDTELEEFVLAFDPRVTYWPQQQTQLFKDAFQTKVSARLEGSGELSPIGILEPDESSGRLRYHWRVDVTSETTVHVRSMLPPYREETQTYAKENQRSGLCSFIGSSLKFNFTGPVGSSWYVVATAKPKRSMGDVLASLKDLVTAADDREIFGVPPTGNAATWYALWREHPHYAYQLGGLLLGVANYLDQRR